MDPMQNNNNPNIGNQPNYQSRPTNYMYTQYPVVNNSNNNSMAVASMVLGIISLVMCCVFYLAIPCGIVALVLGCVAQSKNKSGMAVAGIIMGSISLALSIMVIVFMVIGSLYPYSDFSVQVTPDYYGF